MEQYKALDPDSKSLYVAAIYQKILTLSYAISQTVMRSNWNDPKSYVTPLTFALAAINSVCAIFKITTSTIIFERLIQKPNQAYLTTVDLNNAPLPNELKWMLLDSLKL